MPQMQNYPYDKLKQLCTKNVLVTYQIKALVFTVSPSILALGALIHSFTELCAQTFTAGKVRGLVQQHLLPASTPSVQTEQVLTRAKSVQDHINEFLSDS